VPWAALLRLRPPPWWRLSIMCLPTGLG